MLKQGFKVQIQSTYDTYVLETVLIVTPKLTCLINVNDPQSTNPKYKALILNISSQTKLQLSS